MFLHSIPIQWRRMPYLLTACALLSLAGISCGGSDIEIPPPHRLPGAVKPIREGEINPIPIPIQGLIPSPKRSV